jgi:hypothetical protein
MSESNIFEAQRIIDEINFDSIFAYEQIFSTFLYLNELSFPSYLLKKGTIFWRTRNNNDETFENFSDVSCPPTSKVFNYSRANKPQQSMFYISDHFETNLIELLPSWSSDSKVGERFFVTITSWELQEDLCVMCVPEINSPMFKDYINKKYNENEKSFLNWITEKFSSNTIENRNIYKFTSALCNVFLSRETKTKVWGTLYPSVHRKEEIGKGYNVAVIPEACDYFVLKEVFKQEIIKSGEKQWSNFSTPEKAKLNYKSQEIIWNN